MSGDLKVDVERRQYEAEIDAAYLTEVRSLFFALIVNDAKDPKTGLAATRRLRDAAKAAFPGSEQ